MPTEIETLERAVLDAKQRLLEARRRQPRTLVVRDYEFIRPDGSHIRLSQLFGDKHDLIVIHNMGRKCAYCTMWADGLTGLAKHLMNRAALVLVSPDRPEVLREFAASRGWNYPVVSTAASPFNNEMWRVSDESGTPWPGTSTYRKHTDGRIEQVGRTTFGPGDDFCPVWHFFDLLSEGANGWEPKYAY